MDTLPDKEFIAIFDRTTEYMSLKGCLTPDEIDGRMKELQKIMLLAKHGSKTKRAKHRWGKKFKSVSTLRKKRFADRVIWEAIMHPKSYISLNLQYGKKRAREIMLQRQRKRQAEQVRLRRGRMRPPTR